jgi:Phytanoyl-CoA dioxygenase (PhyH)
VISMLKNFFKPEPHRDLIFDCSSNPDPRMIRRTLYRQGCAVLRGMVSPADIDRYATLAQHAFDVCKGMLQVLEVHEDEATDSIKDARLRKFVSNVRIGQIERDYFVNLNEGADLYDVLMADQARRALVMSILGREWFPGASVLRRISPNVDQHYKLWQQPIRMHCDGPTLSRHTYALNFWVPVEDCVGEVPGLQLVPGPFAEMQARMKHDWDTCSVDDKIELELQALYSSGQDGRPRFIPLLQRGDVVVFHNWVMHATHATADMTKPRSSFELRFNAPERSDFEAFAG